MKIKFKVKRPDIDAIKRKAIDKNRRILMKCMFKMEELAISRAPFDTGFLRQRITLFPQVLAGKYELRSAAEYSCILGSREHVVNTISGHKNIGTLKIGDKVMTQSGNYEKIEAINSFFAIKKPDYVEIITEYKKNYTHKLKLSLDHKVMTVNKDNCLFWIEAGKLKKGDCVFQLRKSNDNKGIFLSETIDLKCANCNKPYTIRKSNYEKKKGYKYCSGRCQIAGMQGKGNPNYGNKYSDETRKKLSDFHKKRLKDNPEKHPNKILAKKGKRTLIEKKLEDFIKLCKLPYKCQYSIGSYFVDFFIPSLNLIIECDGAYWHKNQENDIERDKNILKINPYFKIIHFHFIDKNFSVKIDPNPVKNVFYIQCNPSMNSYVDLERFEKVKVLSITKKTYIRPKQNQGMKYYDIQVKNFHSFVCNGLLISNSDLEYGNSPRMVKFSDILKWIERKGIRTTAEGKYAFATYVTKKIRTQGVNPQPFFRNSLHEVKVIWLPSIAKEEQGSD